MNVAVDTFLSHLRHSDQGALADSTIHVYASHVASVFKRHPNLLLYSPSQLGGVVASLKSSQRSAFKRFFIFLQETEDLWPEVRWSQLDGLAAQWGMPLPLPFEICRLYLHNMVAYSARRNRDRDSGIIPPAAFLRMKRKHVEVLDAKRWRFHLRNLSGVRTSVTIYQEADTEWLSEYLGFVDQLGWSFFWPRDYGYGQRESYPLEPFLLALGLFHGSAGQTEHYDQKARTLWQALYGDAWTTHEARFFTDHPEWLPWFPCPQATHAPCGAAWKRPVWMEDPGAARRDAGAMSSPTPEPEEEEAPVFAMPPPFKPVPVAAPAQGLKVHEVHPEFIRYLDETTGDGGYMLEFSTWDDYNAWARDRGIAEGPWKGGAVGSA